MKKHRQTTFTDIPQAVKKKVWERDEHRCVLCRRTRCCAPNAHFVARSQGGLGIEENIVTLCLYCHDLYDQSAERDAIREELREYLQSKYPDWNEQKLYYHKYYKREG